MKKGGRKKAPVLADGSSSKWTVVVLNGREVIMLSFEAHGNFYKKNLICSAWELL